MFKRTIMVLVMGAGAAGVLSAQNGKPASGTRTTHDVTVVADQVYTGTMAMAVDGGKVTGDLHLTSPTEIKGKVAGTARDGQLQLEFPFHMTEQGCDGSVKMTIALPASPGPAKGTLAAVGCGQEADMPLEGTIALKPAQPEGKSKDGKPQDGKSKQD
jgi:hypothetical protein